MVDPIRENDLILTLLPTCTDSRTESFCSDPSLHRDMTDIDEPILEKVRIDKAEPNVLCVNVESVPPTLT